MSIEGLLEAVPYLLAGLLGSLSTTFYQTYQAKKRVNAEAKELLKKTGFLQMPSDEEVSY